MGDRAGGGVISWFAGDFRVPSPHGPWHDAEIDRPQPVVDGANAQGGSTVQTDGPVRHKRTSLETPWGPQTRRSRVKPCALRSGHYVHVLAIMPMYSVLRTEYSYVGGWGTCAVCQWFRYAVFWSAEAAPVAGGIRHYVFVGLLRSFGLQDGMTQEARDASEVLRGGHDRDYSYRVLCTEYRR